MVTGSKTFRLFHLILTSKFLVILARKYIQNKVYLFNTHLDHRPGPIFSIPTGQIDKAKWKRTLAWAVPLCCNRGWGVQKSAVTFRGLREKIKKKEWWEGKKVEWRGKTEGEIGERAPLLFSIFFKLMADFVKTPWTGPWRRERLLYSYYPGFAPSFSLRPLEPFPNNIVVRLVRRGLRPPKAPHHTDIIEERKNMEDQTKTNYEENPETMWSRWKICL